MFEREIRYQVTKLKTGKQVECVVVEADWPEYETVWRMIQDRVEGRLNEIESLRQQLHDFICVGNRLSERVTELAKQLTIKQTHIKNLNDVIATSRAAFEELTIKTAGIIKEREILAEGYDEVRDELAVAERRLIDMKKRLSVVTRERDEKDRQVATLYQKLCDMEKTK